MIQKLGASSMMTLQNAENALELCVGFIKLCQLSAARVVCGRAGRNTHHSQMTVTAGTDVRIKSWDETVAL